MFKTPSNRGLSPVSCHRDHVLRLIYDVLMSPEQLDTRLGHEEDEEHQRHQAAPVHHRYVSPAPSQLICLLSSLSLSAQRSDSVAIRVTAAD